MLTAAGRRDRGLSRPRRTRADDRGDRGPEVGAAGRQALAAQASACRCGCRPDRHADEFRRALGIALALEPGDGGGHHWRTAGPRACSGVVRDRMRPSTGCAAWSPARFGLHAAFRRRAQPADALHVLGFAPEEPAGCARRQCPVPPCWPPCTIPTANFADHERMTQLTQTVRTLGLRSRFKRNIVKPLHRQRPPEAGHYCARASHKGPGRRPTRTSQ